MSVALWISAVGTLRDEPVVSSIFGSWPMDVSVSCRRHPSREALGFTGPPAVHRVVGTFKIDSTEADGSVRGHGRSLCMRLSMWRSRTGAAACCASRTMCHRSHAKHEAKRCGLALSAGTSDACTSGMMRSPFATQPTPPTEPEPIPQVPFPVPRPGEPPGPIPQQPPHPHVPEPKRYPIHPDTPGQPIRTIDVHGPDLVGLAGRLRVTNSLGWHHAVPSARDHVGRADLLTDLRRDLCGLAGPSLVASFRITDRWLSRARHDVDAASSAASRSAKLT